MFGRIRDGSHVFRTSFQAATSFLNSDMCAMHGHVYTAGNDEDLDGVIHKHTLDGLYVASFGARYNSPHLIVRQEMAEGGYMECNETHGILLYTQPNAPIATAFIESGELIWRIKFANARIVPKGARHTDAGQAGIVSLVPPVSGSTEIATTGGRTEMRSG